jgi:hypothetical protein
MIRAILSNTTPPSTFTISVVSAQPEMGTVVGGGTFPYGSNIQIEAVPYPGYEFLRWADGYTINPRTVTVTGNATYTAHFQPTVGIEDRAISNVEIYSTGGRIIVNGAEGTSVEIFDITGRLITKDICNELSHRVFNVNASGIYIVRTGNGMTKKVHVIR